MSSRTKQGVFVRQVRLQSVQFLAEAGLEGIDGDRSVSVNKPYVRPIVRGKEAKKFHFAKANYTGKIGRSAESEAEYRWIMGHGNAAAALEAKVALGIIPETEAELQYGQNNQITK